MVCEHVYMNISPSNYRACYGPGVGAEYTVEICSKPTCSFCTHHSLGKKKIPCKHIIWVMTSVLKISKQSDLLQQVVLIESEIKAMLKDAPAEGNYR